MPEGNSPELIKQNTFSEDKISDTKTIYNASAGEIFWRNFLAGFSRTAGALILYIVFILITGTLAVKLLTPFITPLLKQLNSIYGTVQKVPNLPSF